MSLEAATSSFSLNILNSLYNMYIVYTKLVGRGAREKRAKEGRKEAPPAVNES